MAGSFIISENCGSYVFYDCTAWTGLNDIDIEGTYIWDHSNASLTFTNWYPKEPSLSKPELALSRDCIDILRGGGWNDRPCNHLNWVICEKQSWLWFIDWSCSCLNSVICEKQSWHWFIDWSCSCLNWVICEKKSWHWFIDWPCSHLNWVICEKQSWL